MAQVTIYLDKELEEEVRAAAAAAGRSLSAYIADVLRGPASARDADPKRMLPADFWERVGTFPDFPLAEEIRRDDVPDLPRIDPFDP